ncbi:Mismatch repair ATPase (MutS family) [Archaeoglobus sulfaticallidus PM70-1]|uniref:DNA-binding protein MutS2 n=1 Tax=Archaeoglobus sulfaticallidus PM70-1 TaxID=387631 RepID=N0BI15_9EURY|nr:Mismatch repair ATPase (MutS family) [Archaeoglobus sulfaticallidus]AGK61937.1 Mismatch repair ATPase (MutS family) [Archaeoglobus sulfaticallidus PM70-1]
MFVDFDFNTRQCKLSRDAKEIYRAILSEIRDRLIFEESRDFLSLFKPVADKNEILKRQNYFKKIFEKINSVELHKFDPLNFRLKRLNDRVVFTEEPEKAISLGLCDVNVVGDYPLVLSPDGGRFNRIEIQEVSAEEIAPEVFVEELYSKRDTLLAVEKIMNSISINSVAPEILREIDRYEEIVGKENRIKEFEEFVHKKLGEIKESIEKRLEKEKIVLSGRDILEFMQKGSFDVFSIIEDAIFEEVLKAEQEIAEKFGFRAEFFVRKVMPEINFDELERVKQELERELTVERYMLARDIMRKIKHILPKLKEEFEIVYELDIARAIRSYLGEFIFPQIGNCIYFREARNLFIRDPQPVTYFVGFDTIENFSEDLAKGVVVLTGANSGGKTSLLMLIVQIQVLAQMGFPVPAEQAVVNVLDEIFFFKKKKSVYGAGAFETALKSLINALKGKGRKLILLDEFEAITEPGAGVKILSALLKVAYEKRFYTVVVSHLGHELELDFVRVDGIYAKGLDDELNLIVDRQPKFGAIGRSTPELIVERIYLMSKGEEKKIVEMVRKVFQE